MLHSGLGRQDVALSVFPLERIGFRGEFMIGWHIFCLNGNRKEVRLVEQETDEFEIME